MSEDEKPASSEQVRRPWREGPDERAARSSWLRLPDDELLHNIEAVGPDENADERLLEVVESDRHFFLRQEAAKKIRNRSLLFAFEDDRHVAQILIRHLNRREDVTYLERMVARSHHAEVRGAAQIQLAHLWDRLGGPSRASARETEAPPPPEFQTPEEAPSEKEVEAAAAAESGDEGVDGSLLGWAVHFVTEQAWERLGTDATRSLLHRTHAEMLPHKPALCLFRVEGDAHVTVDLSGGPLLARESVGAVARWMAAFLAGAREVSAEAAEVDVRQATSLMADALEAVGFYAAYDEAEGPDT